MTEKPDFRSLAKELIKDPMDMVYTLILRHQTAQIEEWYEQISSRNQRIRDLESLLRRAGLRLDRMEDRDLRTEISEALDHDPDKS